MAWEWAAPVPSPSHNQGFTQIIHQFENIWIEDLYNRAQQRRQVRLVHFHAIKGWISFYQRESRSHPQTPPSSPEILLMCYTLNSEGLTLSSRQRGRRTHWRPSPGTPGGQGQSTHGAGAQKPWVDFREDCKQPKGSSQIHTKTSPRGKQGERSTEGEQ